MGEFMKQTSLTLSDFKPGEIAKIFAYQQGNGEYRKKLLAMGLTPGTCFEVVRLAPLGDPVQIVVRNFSLSLRKKEAALLQLERVTPE
jgi:ferrous iron transport protein A